MHLMAQLPYDVWMHIAKFLPRNTLRILFGVNHTFYELAMDLRYREAVLHSDFDAHTRWSFVRLQDPSIAPRVHKLLLQPTVFLDRNIPSPRLVDRIKLLLLQLLRRSPPLVNPPFGTPEQALKKLTYAFSIMSNLTYLRVYYVVNFQGTTSFGTGLPCLLVAWTALGPNLRELVLDTTLECMNHALSPSLVFPKLELLNISLYGLFYLKTGATTQTVPITFINNHQSTLKSFRLAATFSSISDAHLKLLFLGLGHFPHLEVISVDVPWSISFTHYFLPLHVHRLNRLMIPGIRNSAKFPLPLESPSLSSLVLGLDRKLPNLPGAVPFLAPLAASLELLSLRGYRFTFHDVCKILDVFTPRNRLHTLTLELEFVSPQFFDLCSEKLPGLRNLALYIGDYKDMDIDGGSIVANEAMFCQHIRLRRYTNWSLHNLHINARRLRVEGEKNHCNAALKELFPSVTSCDGGHSEPLFMSADTFSH